MRITIHLMLGAGRYQQQATLVGFDLREAVVVVVDVNSRYSREADDDDALPD